MTPRRISALLLLLAVVSAGHLAAEPEDGYGHWMKKPQGEWPHIALVSSIEFTDSKHPVAPSGFLLEHEGQVLAATAKHVLVYFKSERMDSVSFKGTLERWTMFPKHSPADVVLLDRLVNEAPDEKLKRIPAARDWILLTIKERSPRIQPLRPRRDPIEPGEPVFVVGWRYTDSDQRQVVYEGRFVKAEKGSRVIDVKELVGNKVGGLSGAPVIDGNGYVIGIMSRSAGKMQRISSTEYPLQVLAGQ